jgi:ATP adenylyltransferase
VSLERLWAGWRADYVGSTGDAESGADAGRPAPHAAVVNGDAESGAGAGEPAPRAALVNGDAGEPAPGAALNGDAPSANDCVFCAIVASSESDEERYVVWSSDTIVALLNAYPYASGHLLVMPRRHVRELEELTSAEASQLWQAVHDAAAAVKVAYRPEGLNLGVNLGRAAGAGIPAHLHVHVVPRWIGDTNFMTAAAEVRVLPEALPVTWKRIRSAWES